MFQMPGSKSKAPLRMLAVVSGTLAANVALNNTGTAFDGPSITLGTGIWLVIGRVNLVDTVGAAGFTTNLTDGVNTGGSARLFSPAANQDVTCTIAGIFTNPAGPVKMTAQDSTSVNGVMKRDATGGTNNSQIFAVRIG